MGIVIPTRVCVYVCVWELVEITHIRISSMLLGTQEHSLNDGNVSSTTQKVTNIESLDSEPEPTGDALSECTN